MSKEKEVEVGWFCTYYLKKFVAKVLFKHRCSIKNYKVVNRLKSKNKTHQP